MMFNKLTAPTDASVYVGNLGGITVECDFLATYDDTSYMQILGRGGTSSSTGIRYSGGKVSMSVFVSESRQGFVSGDATTVLNKVGRIKMKAVTNGSNVDLSLYWNGGLIGTRTETNVTMGSNMSVLFNDNGDTLAPQSNIANLKVSNYAETQVYLDLPLQGDFTNLAGSDPTMSGTEGVDYRFVDKEDEL